MLLRPLVAPAAQLLQAGREGRLLQEGACVHCPALRRSDTVHRRPHALNQDARLHADAGML